MCSERHNSTSAFTKEVQMWEKSFIFVLCLSHLFVNLFRLDLTKGSFPSESCTRMYIVKHDSWDIVQTGI